MSAIRVAVDALGGVSRLARAIGVTPPSVHQWLRGSRPIPPAQCIPIETATNGAVTRYDLRPDVFGAPPTEQKAA